MTASWYVCRAPSDWSRLQRGLDECRRAGVEVYVPMLWVPVRVRAVGSRRMRTEKQVPAYPGYAFAREPLVIAGIASLVYGGEPVRVAVAVLDRVRAAELDWHREHDARARRGADPYLPGETARIGSGLFADQLVTVVGQRGSVVTVRLPVPMLGCDVVPIRVELLQRDAVAVAA
jgi:hypothetical protein